MRAFVTFCLFAALAVAQVNINVGTIQVSQDAALSVRQHLITQIDREAGRLGSSILAGATSITVTGTAPAVGEAILIDSEAMAVTAVSGQTLTVTRAHLATTAAAHARDSMVRVLKYRTFREWVRLTLLDAVSAMMDQYPAGSIATANATIATAEAEKAAAKTGAVQ